MIKMKKGSWFAIKIENEGKVEKMKTGRRKRKKEMWVVLYMYCHLDRPELKLSEIAWKYQITFLLLSNKPLFLLIFEECPTCFKTVAYYQWLCVFDLLRYLTCKWCRVPQGKCHHKTRHESAGVRYKYSSNLSLTSALDRGG